MKKTLIAAIQICFLAALSQLGYLCAARFNLPLPGSLLKGVNEMMLNARKLARPLVISAGLFLAFTTSCNAEDQWTAAQEMFAEHHFSAGLVHLQKAAESGDRRARRTLGLMLLYGKSLYTEVLTDRAQGLRWLRLAAIDGCETSRYILSKL